MDTDTHVREALERAIAHRPAADPMGTLVRDGKAALRRRRRRAGLASLAAVAVLGAGAAALDLVPGGGPAPDGTRAVDGRFASEPPTPEPGWITEPVTIDPALVQAMAEAFVVSRDGLSVPDDAVVHERRDDIYAGFAGSSVALDVTWRDQRWWLVADWSDEGASQRQRPAAPGGSFEEFVTLAQAQGPSATPAEGGPEFPLGGYAAYDGTRFTVAEGSEIVDEAGFEYAGGGLVRGAVLDVGGTTVWVAAGGTHPRQQGWIEAGESGGLSFEQWLDRQADEFLTAAGALVTELDSHGRVSPARKDVRIAAQEAYDGPIPCLTGTTPDGKQACWLDGPPVRASIAEVTVKGRTLYVLSAVTRSEHLTVVWSSTDVGPGGLAAFRTLLGTEDASDRTLSVSASGYVGTPPEGAR